MVKGKKRGLSSPRKLKKDHFFWWIEIEAALHWEVERIGGEKRT